MKKQNVLILILLATLALGACDKLNLGGSNLVGTWDVTLSAKTYSNGSIEEDTTLTDLGTFTFNKAGDGNYSLQMEEQTSSGTFDWFIKDNKMFINNFNLQDSIMTKNLAVGFDIVTNTKTQQVWTAEYSYYTDNYVEATDSYVKALYKISLELELNKQ